MAHPDILLLWQALEHYRVVIDNFNISSAIFRIVGWLNFAAQIIRHQLHAVADPQNWNTQLVDFWIDLKGVLCVDTVGAPRENDAFGMHFFDFFSAQLVGEQFGIDAKITNPARNQLVVLTTEVEHEDLVECIKIDVSHLVSTPFVKDHCF